MFEPLNYDEIKEQIQAQYRGTNIDELLNGIIEIKKKYILNAMKSLYNDNLSLSTAKGIGLDLWGNLLHLSRYIPTESEKDTFQYFNFNAKNFQKLIFYDYTAPTYSFLSDNYFKELLILLYRGFWVFPSIPKLNEFSQETFNNYGKVVVRDTTDMSYQVYVFSNKIPLWLKFMFANYDILPRPAGVGFKVIERILRRFGFNPLESYKKPNYNFFNFERKNFNNLLFYDEKNIYKDYIHNKQEEIISEQEREINLKFFKENISGFFNSSFYDHFKEGSNNGKN